MKQFLVILCFTFATVSAQRNGYRYSGPPTVQQQQQQQQQHAPVRHSTPTGGFQPSAPQSGGGAIYSAVQSPPLSSFSLPASAPAPTFTAPQPVPQAIPISPPPQQISAPAPVSQSSYLPPPPPPPQPQQQPIFAPLPAPLQAPVFQAPVSFPQPQEQSYQPSFQPTYQSFQRPQTAIVTKDIYIHSAPDDHEEAALGQQLDNAPVRKNYRIVFIKAPSQNLNLAAQALKRAQATHEEKTVIYVLSKKPDLSEVQQQLQNANTDQRASKPEVYFIKYRTQEEAQRAQQEIQAQYDALGGSTHISDEGVAPLAPVSATRGEALLSLPIGAPQSTYGAPPSFSQQSFQSQTSSISFGDAPSPRYLPSAKTKK